MDPPEAASILASAGLSYVPTDRGHVQLAALTRAEIDSIRKNRCRQQDVTIAKRYIKACDALLALKTSLASSPTRAELRRPEMRLAPTPARTMFDPACRTADVFDRHGHGLLDSYRRSIYVRFLVWSFHQLIKLAWFVPIFCGFALLAYIVHGLWFVAHNLDQLVVAGFLAADYGYEAGPSYLLFAFGRVAGQFYNETKARLR